MHARQTGWMWFCVAILCWLLPALVALSSDPITSSPPNPAFAESLPDLNSSSLLKTILHRNLLMVVVNLAGVLSFGTISLLNLAVNGMTMGAVTQSALSAGMSWQQIMRYTLPHSLEFVGLWLSGAVGLRGAKHGYKLLRYGKFPELGDIQGFMPATLYSIIFIVVAAWLEVHVSLDSLTK